jgi:hypothetical protein
MIKKLFGVLLLFLLIFAGYSGYKILLVYIEEFQVKTALRETAKKAVHPAYKDLAESFLQEKIRENNFPFPYEAVSRYEDPDGTIRYEVTYSRIVEIIPENRFTPPLRIPFTFTVEGSAHRVVW